MKTYLLTFLILLCIIHGRSADVGEPNIELDSLSRLLDGDLSKTNRLNVLHHACQLIYGQDSDHERLINYAEEGVDLAMKLDSIVKGSDLAVWILRSNIYLRSYDRNTKYYELLKELYESGQINQDKYIHPLYSEIYSYIDYGKMKEAEKKMEEFASLIHKDNHKHQTYYLDLYISFKRKAKENREVAIALEKFAYHSKQIDDPRFAAFALSRNSEFFLDDSLDYHKAKYYALEALDLVNSKNLEQLKQPILLQLAKAHYMLEEESAFQSIFSQIKIDSKVTNDNILSKDYYTFAGDIEFDNGDYDAAIKKYMKAVQFLQTSDFSTMEVLTKKIEKSFVKVGNYESAYKYSNRLNTLQDSLYNEENLKAVKLFETRLRFKDVETERIKLENKIRSQKRSTIYIGFFTSLILLSLIFYNRILDEKVKIRTAALGLKNKELKSSLEELEQFNYIASHDIKEPMRVVSSITGLIEKKLQRDNKHAFKSEFKLVNNSITQLYTLIEDLSQFLDFKSKSVTHQMIDSENLMNQVSHMLSKVRSEINGEVIINDLPKIYSSTALLTVIFKNLIENGLKYNKSEKPTVEISYQLTDGRHEFIFQDNGIGIEEKYHDYVFQMFKRLENRDKKGSGLGLGLVSKSLEKLDGEIKLSSELGKGSTFSVLLPQSYIVSNN